MIKRKNKLISVSLATIMLVSLVAVTSLSASAAPTVKAVTASAPALWKAGGYGAVVVSSTDGNVYYAPSSLMATPVWTSIGKPVSGVSGDPAVVLDAGGSIHVFVNSAGALWVKVLTPAFAIQADWAEVPGTTLAAGMGPGACWDGTNLDVFYVGSASNELEHIYQIGGAGFWSPAQNLGGVLSSSPSACSVAAGSIDVFGRGQSGGLWQIEYATGGFGGWNEVPGYGYLLAGTGPSAVCGIAGPPAGTIWVFVAGGSGQLYYQVYDGNTKTWHTAATGTGYYLVGGTLSASPSACVNSAFVTVMVRGGDGNLYFTAVQTNIAPPLVWGGWSNAIVNVP